MHNVDKVGDANAILEFVHSVRTTAQLAAQGAGTEIAKEIAALAVEFEGAVEEKLDAQPEVVLVYRITGGDLTSYAKAAEEVSA